MNRTHESSRSVVVHNAEFDRGPYFVEQGGAGESPGEGFDYVGRVVTRVERLVGVNRDPTGHLAVSLCSHIHRNPAKTPPIIAYITPFAMAATVILNHQAMW